MKLRKRTPRMPAPLAEVSPRTPVEAWLDIDIPELRKPTPLVAACIDRTLAYINVVEHDTNSLVENVALLDNDLALADLEAGMVSMERAERAEREWTESYISALEAVLGFVPSCSEAEIAEMLALAESERGQ